VVPTRRDGRVPSGRQREPAATVLLDDGEQHRVGVDSGPAQPRNAPGGVDERSGTTVRQERVVTDRVLHPAAVYRAAATETGC